MFDQDYEIRGKHATYAKYLRDTAKVFKRHIDIYMVGAIMGFLHGRYLPEDTTSKDNVRIFASVFIKEKLKCEFIYRLLMILDETTGLTLEQRTDRAFRDDTDKEAMAQNMNLFHSYVRGGIEYLYEKFGEESTTADDYIDNVYEMVYQFKQDIEVQPSDESIEKIISS